MGILNKLFGASNNPKAKIDAIWEAAEKDDPDVYFYRRFGWAVLAVHRHYTQQLGNIDSEPIAEINSTGYIEAKQQMDSLREKLDTLKSLIDSPDTVDACAENELLSNVASCLDQMEEGRMSDYVLENPVDALQIVCDGKSKMLQLFKAEGINGLPTI